MSFSFEDLNTSSKKTIRDGITLDGMSFVPLKDYVGKELHVGRVAGESFENYYSLAVCREDAERILNGEGGIKLRSAVHKAIIGALESGFQHLKSTPKKKAKRAFLFSKFSTDWHLPIPVSGAGPAF